VFLKTLMSGVRIRTNARLLLLLFIVISTSLTSTHLRAETGDKVYFAGVAFTNDAADINTAYPHVSSALSNGGNTVLNQDIRRQLQTAKLSIDVSFDSLGSIKDASKSTALALGIDAESVSVEHIGNNYKMRVEVAAEALFFDFKEKQVLGGFPFTLDFIDVSPAPPTQEAIQTAIRNIVFGAPGQHSLAGEFVATLAHARIPNAANKHLRVTSVTLGTKAVDYLHEAAPDLDAKTLPMQVAQEFGKYLAANQQISILPYSSNQALGSSMAARFVEGEAYQLKIPEADYEIHLDVAGFKKVEQNHNNIATLFVYGAFVDVTVLEPLSGKVYFSQRVKQGDTKQVPTSQTTLDDWAPAYETMLDLFNNFTQSLSSTHAAWTKSGLPDNRSAHDQFSSLSELIQSCR
jgi:hypothetical protein